MSAELAHLRREFSLAIASCFYENQEHVRAIELLYQFRASEPEEFRPAATRALLCQLLTHYSPESLRRVFEIELSQLALADQHLFSSALAILVDEEVTSSDLVGIEQASEHEWLWHFPLGWNAWRKHDRLRAWRHFERFLALESRSGYSGGWMREKAKVLLFWERTCEICQEDPAHDFYRSSKARRLAICPACQELQELEPLAARCELKRSDPKMKLLGRLEFVPELVSSLKWPKTESPPPSPRIPLAYRRTSTLMKLLSPEALSVIERARKLAADVGVGEANSCAILAALTEDPSPIGLSGREQQKVREQSVKLIVSDSPKQLAMILNLAYWDSILSIGSKGVIDVNSLHIGALYCNGGKAWSVWKEILPHGVWSLLSVSHSEVRNRYDETQRLQARFPDSIYLRCVLAEASTWDIDFTLEEQCNFLREAPDRVPQFRNWHQTTWTQRARLIESWRDALMFQNESVLLSLCHQSVNYYFPELGCAASFLAATRDPEQPWWWWCVAWRDEHPHSSRTEATIQLERIFCNASPTSEDWQYYGLALAKILASSGDTAKAQELLASTPYADGTPHEKRESDFLAFSLALERNDLKKAEQILLQVPIDAPHRYFYFAVELWSRGRREAFWKALARLRDEPEAGPIFVDSVTMLFQTKEAYWTQEMIDEARATRESLTRY